MPTPAAVSFVRRAVRAALAIERDAPDGWRWRGGVPADEILDAVAAHRVAPLLDAAAERCGLPADVTGPLQALHRTDRLEAMLLIHSTGAVAGQLAGIDHLFLKGPALGVQTTGDPTARGGGDVDVVVRPADLGAAVDRLLAAGWIARPGYTVNQASWAWRHQLRATYELGLEGTLGTLDLHWRLDPTHGALPPFDDLWSRRTHVDIGSATVATLAPHDALAHALRHAAKDRWSSLRSLIDIARLTRDPRTRSDTFQTDRLDRLDRATLSVVDATIGLPPTAPRFASIAAGIPTALHTQVHVEQAVRFPGDRAQRFARYMLASGRGPRDLATTAAMIGLPPVLLADIDAERFLPAIAAAAGRRVTHALGNLRERR